MGLQYGLTMVSDVQHNALGRCATLATSMWLYHSCITIAFGMLIPRAPWPPTLPAPPMEVHRDADRPRYVYILKAANETCDVDLGMGRSCAGACMELAYAEH